MLSCICFSQDFILEHYSEDGNSYEDEIADLMDLRQVVHAHSLIRHFMVIASDMWLVYTSGLHNNWFQNHHLHEHTTVYSKGV